MTTEFVEKASPPTGPKRLKARGRRIAKHSLH
jgi:hypothetical protein